MADGRSRNATTPRPSARRETGLNGAATDGQWQRARTPVSGRTTPFRQRPSSPQAAGQLRQSQTSLSNGAGATPPVGQAGRMVRPKSAAPRYVVESPASPSSPSRPAASNGYNQPGSLRRSSSQAYPATGAAANRTGDRTPPPSARYAGSTLPGGFSRGERVRGGPKGAGTVIGPATGYAIRNLAVSVQWDSGQIAEERCSVLTRADSRADSPPPLKAVNGNGYANGGYNGGIDQGLSDEPANPLDGSDGQMNTYATYASQRPRRRSALGAPPAPGQQANPVDFLGLHARKLGMGNESGTPRRAPTPRRERSDSHLLFADKQQTVIIYDWDDTLFPTHYVLGQLQMNPDLPLARQPRLNMGRMREVVPAKIAACEDKACEVVRNATLCGHCVIVTLAAATWFEKACNNFFPKFGRMVKQMGIKVAYAQSPVRIRKARAKAKTEEQFWGLVKGLCIAEEIENIYTQYEGQTWKNVISIGDSVFERYGTLAASTAYMQGRRLSKWELTPYTRPLQPTQKNEWQKVDQNDHVVRLRVKCCKLVGQPDVDELIIQLDLVSKWLNHMVKCDAGFDLNLEHIEGESQVAVVEAVLKGDRAQGKIPRAIAIAF
eukprot:TRINITY_DN13765_c0_g1_i1.p1 TRINITY_DN13765_c0_g1~~TRINITY_DN13765_c0_g1_i1.p1  ORF type:complete len:606 (-),score=109.40 TRINITY_DN13765_c0_g1_i1:99-1916(-)